MRSLPPVLTAVVDAHELDAAGVSAVLARFSERVPLVELGTGPTADVILYGVREEARGHDEDLHRLLRSHPVTVIALDWREESPQTERALACGAHGRLSKTLPGDQLVARIEHLHRTRDRAVVLPSGAECGHPAVPRARLTPRELEMLILITAGLTNQEIADQAFISINSVKTYVRMAYRKIGVTRRSQAVSWGIEHGLDTATSLERVAPRAPL